MAEKMRLLPKRNRKRRKKYKGIKEDMGTTEEAPTGIRWDFETNKDNNLIDTVDVDSCFADSVAPC